MLHCSPSKVQAGPSQPHVHGTTADVWKNLFGLILKQAQAPGPWDVWQDADVETDKELNSEV